MLLGGEVIQQGMKEHACATMNDETHRLVAESSSKQVREVLQYDDKLLPGQVHIVTGLQRRCNVRHHRRWRNRTEPQWLGWYAKGTP